MSAKTYRVGIWGVARSSLDIFFQIPHAKNLICWGPKFSVFNLGGIKSTKKYFFHQKISFDFHEINLWGQKQCHQRDWSPILLKKVFGRLLVQKAFFGTFWLKVEDRQFKKTPKGLKFHYLFVLYMSTIKKNKIS